LAHSARAIEIEDIEARVAELEWRAPRHRAAQAPGAPGRVFLRTSFQPEHCKRRIFLSSGFI